MMQTLKEGDLVKPTGIGRTRGWSEDYRGVVVFGPIGSHVVVQWMGTDPEAEETAELVQYEHPVNEVEAA